MSCGICFSVTRELSSRFPSFNSSKWFENHESFATCFGEKGLQDSKLVMKYCNSTTLFGYLFLLYYVSVLEHGRRLTGLSPCTRLFQASIQSAPCWTHAFDCDGTTVWNVFKYECSMFQCQEDTKIHVRRAPHILRAFIGVLRGPQSTSANAVHRHPRLG
jgi:hypothetical protein